MVDSVAAAARPPRLASLDTMRGLVIALMLLVNMTWNAAALPAQLFHVPWNAPEQGATLTDLVFPWFVFMMGAAVPLSVRSGRGRGCSAAAMLRGATLRGAKIYLWGVLLTIASYATTRPITWRSLFEWNILQLIGVAYVVTVAVWLLPRAGKIAFVVATLLAKWATLLLPWEWVSQIVTPRPPAGAPTGPGTWAHFDAIGQLLHGDYVPVATLSSLLIGWIGMADQFLPLATIAVLGGLATECLVPPVPLPASLGREARYLPAARLAALGLSLLLIAVLLQWGYQPEGGGLWGTATAPYSKWFFTPAYCLLAAGSATLLLAGCHASIDIGGLPGTAWLQAMGRNALAVYVGAELSFKLIFAKWLVPLPDGGSDSIAAGVQAWLGTLTGSPAAASLGWALLWIVGWAAIAWRLDRRGIYWRV
ncbi:heparan-alpha-glucosaminide N-acetyltransferase domain-containing protein [Botrimarina hoheduenensis]|nr:heparan-alpha-glucosaminide N-acetyltransferase domain-containing protein [Botrimarina hoheduenensis]